MTSNETDSDFPKTISVKIEPLEEPILITVNFDDKIGDIIEKIKNYCRENNVDLDQWAIEKLGTKKFQFMFMRK